MAFEGGDDPIVWRLFRELRARRLPLGLDDYSALRRAMREGFGLNSRTALRDLCVALWAKSRQEAEIVVARFDALGLPDWTPAEVAPDPISEPSTTPTTPEQPAKPSVGTSPIAPARVLDPAVVREVRRAGGLPPLGAEGVQWSDRSFVFAPQFPINYREAAQTWRRLRRPVRIGPPIELDVDQTLHQRANRGVVSAPVLVPRRRNVARLLVLVDRQGSMTPFHDFVDEVCLAVVRAASLQHVAVHYFKNLPSSGADVRVLDRLTGQISPTLDRVLGEIKPIELGSVSRRSDLQDTVPLESVLDDMGAGAGVAIVSDAGAARRAYQPRRLLDTVAFLKALRLRASTVVWLNPIDRDDWRSTTAGQIARHSPMFSLTRSDLHAAVDVLRGRPAHLERPL
jgi:uncharacterized protein